MQTVDSGLYKKALDTLDSLEFHYRDSFRNLLKFISSQSPDGDLLLKEGEPYFFTFLKELKDMIPFNIFRNIFEQYKRGRIKLNFDELTQTFTEINELAEQDVYAEIYSRIHSKNSLGNKNLWSVFGYLFDPTNIKEFESSIILVDNGTRLKFDNRVFQKVFNICFKSMEFPNDYEPEAFTEYEIDDYVNILAYLETEAVLKIKLYLLHHSDFLMYIPNIHYDDLITEMDLFFDHLNKERIISILEFLKYDEQYEKDKTTIFEPIFIMDGQVFYSAFSFIYSDLVDKVLYKLIKNNEKTQTRNNNIRATKMERKYAEFVGTNSHLKVNNSFRFKCKNISGEYDVCVYDPKTKSLLVLELKWYDRVEGERDAFANDIKIQREIEKCQKREEIIRNNLNSFTRRAFDANVEVENIKSIIISEGYLPIKHISDSNIVIVDDYIFKNEWSKAKGDVAEFVDSISREDLYKDYVGKHKMVLRTCTCDYTLNAFLICN